MSLEDGLRETIAHFRHELGLGDRRISLAEMAASFVPISG